MPPRFPLTPESVLLMKRGVGRPSVSVILSWPAPNHINPARKTWLTPYSLIFLVLTTILLGARLWSRYKRQSGGLGLDDAIIVPAWIFGIINTALIIVAMDNGFGMHAWDLTLEMAEKSALFGWLAEGCFLITTSLTKISILLFYRRLASGSYNRVWKICTLTAIAFVVQYMVIFLMFLIFACIPTEAFWKQFDLAYGSDFKCMDVQIPSVLVGSFSVITDLYSVLLPLWLFWSLQMPKRQKLALWGVFAVGFFTVGCGIARTFYLNKMATTPNADVPWVAYDVLLWSVNEANLAFICASLPALKPFFARYLFPPASRAITSAKAFSHKLASAVNLPYPQRSRTGTGWREIGSTGASRTLVGGPDASLDSARFGKFGGSKDRIDDVTWYKFGESESGSVLPKPGKKSLRAMWSSHVVKQREPQRPKLYRALPSLSSRENLIVHEKNSEVERDIVQDLNEKVDRLRVEFNGGLAVQKTQHSRQASNASDKPLPKLPDEPWI